MFVEEYHFIKNNLSETELDRIIRIFEICQPLQVYIPIIFQNYNKMKSFLNYYNSIPNNNMYFKRKVYKIEQDLPKEDFKNLIKILLYIQPDHLYIHDSYIEKSNNKSNEDLFILLSNYIIKSSNVDDYIYYKKRTHPALPPR